MEFIGDLLKIFWPLLLIYAISKIQRFAREQKKQEKGTVAEAADIQQRLQRRREILAEKQQKTQQRPQATQPKREPHKAQSIAPQKNDPYTDNSYTDDDAYNEDLAEKVSDEELMERLGVAEYEHQVEVGAISAKGQHVDIAPLYAADHHDTSTQILKSIPIRQFVIAREILDKPRAMRPYRPPFQS